MSRSDFAQVAKVRCSGDGQWFAAIGYFSAKDAVGLPIKFVEHDRLFASSKPSAIANARAEYPGIAIDTLTEHLFPS